MLLGCCSGADWRVDCCSCNSDAVPNPVAHPPMHAWYPGLPTSSGTGPGFVKISVAKDSDTILGATIVAPHAGDMISEITTCIQFGVGVRSQPRLVFGTVCCGRFFFLADSSALVAATTPCPQKHPATPPSRAVLIILIITQPGITLHSTHGLAGLIDACDPM